MYRQQERAGIRQTFLRKISNRSDECANEILLQRRYEELIRGRSYGTRTLACKLESAPYLGPAAFVPQTIRHGCIGSRQAVGLHMCNPHPAGRGSEIENSYLMD
jgi:hypothetical protein